MTGWRIWWLIFATVLLTHLPFVALPAGHDASWSVMAGAQTLAATGFDYPSLIKMDGFYLGGPSTHATSPVTLVAAIVIALVGTGTSSLVILHILHMAIGSAGLWFTYHLARVLLPNFWAIGSTVAVGLTPIVFTQFGTMYLETPLLAVVMGALWFAHHDRWVAAGLFTLIASAIKPTGLVVAAGLLIGTALMRRDRMVRAVPIFMVSAAIVFWQNAISDRPPNRLFNWDLTYRVWRLDWLFIMVTPLTMILTLVYALGFARWWQTRHDQDPLLAMIAPLPMVFIAGVLAGPLLGQPINLGPRYWVVVIPAMLLTSAVGLESGEGVLPPKSTAFAYITASFLGLFGLLVPGNSVPDLILAERAPTVRHLLLLERDAIGVLQASDAAALVTMGTGFRMEYPSAGYVEKPDADFVQVAVAEPLSDLPDHIIFIQRDSASPLTTIYASQLGEGWTLETTPMNRGPFSITIVEARRLP